MIWNRYLYWWIIPLTRHSLKFILCWYHCTLTCWTSLSVRISKSYPIGAQFLQDLGIFLTLINVDMSWLCWLVVSWLGPEIAAFLTRKSKVVDGWDPSGIVLPVYPENLGCVLKRRRLIRLHSSRFLRYYQSHTRLFGNMKYICMIPS